MSKKVASIFMCLGLVFWLIGFFCTKNTDEKLSGEQYTQGLVLSIIAFIPMIGYLAFLVFAILGIINACQDKEGIPVLDKFGWNWFKSL